MADASKRDLLFADLENEWNLTRKVLERLPEKDFAWKPHERSMSLGQLAAHVANIVYWQEMTLSQDGIDLAKLPPDRHIPATTAELVSIFDKNVAAARAAFATATDASLEETWTLRMGDKVFFALPRRAVFRTMCLSHLIHHRAQLLIYMRMLGVPVPAVYGPSADEPGF